MFMPPVAGFQAANVFASFSFSNPLSEKRSRDAAPSWTPRTATDIQPASTTSRSASSRCRTKNRWPTSISRLFRGSHDGYDNSNNKNNKTQESNDVELQQKRKSGTEDTKKAQAPGRMSSLRLPKAKFRATTLGRRTNPPVREKSQERSSMTTSATTTSSTGNARASTLKLRRPHNHRESSLSTLLSLPDHRTTAPSVTSTLNQRASSEAPPSRSQSPSTLQHNKEPAETSIPLRRGSTIRDWKRKTDRLSLSLSVLAPSARLAPTAMSPNCKSTAEWDRLSIASDTAAEGPCNRPPPVVRSGTERKKSGEKKNRRQRLSVAFPVRFKTEPAPKPRPQSDPDMTGDREFTSLMEEAHGDGKRDGGVEAWELV